MKKIVISVAGTEGKQEYKDVAILPATKPRDVLGKLGLNGLQLLKPDKTPFDLNDNLYDAVADGQKVYASPGKVTAG